ncbi:O-acetyl-ADP-ribose deacetylase [Candidatus Margulisiibacteriota bacterium]
MYKVKINKSEIALKIGDITKEKVDAIVNAANSRLAGGGGVDGAIHRAGGPKIMEECREYPGCPTGQAVITSGGNLPAKYVIHTVGPYYSGKSKDAELLASAYGESLKLAEKNKITSISFPSISTGVYRYPLSEAAKVSLNAVRAYLKKGTKIKQVNFVLYDQRTFDAFEKVLDKIFSE